MKYCVKTDVGVVRKENQDNAKVFVKDNITLAVLCDGMGGHAGGSHASRITIEQFEKEFARSLPKKSSDFGQWFTEVIKKSKKAMEKYATRDKTLLDMGTTVTCALVLPDNIYVYNIGDSRTYIYNGLLHQITTDHNLRNLYIGKHGYSPEEAATLVGATALTSALGPKKKTNIESFLVDNDKEVKNVILTSDGIHDYIEKPSMEKILGSDLGMDFKCEMMIKYAIKGKSADNLTVILLEVD